MAFYRDLFTGELLERRSSGPVLLKRIIPEGVALEDAIQRRRRAGWRNHVSRPLSLLPENATPDKIREENEAARRHGTGAMYDPDGLCHLPDRSARRRELRRKQSIDLDGGYGD